MHSIFSSLVYDVNWSRLIESRFLRYSTTKIRHRGHIGAALQPLIQGYISFTHNNPGQPWLNIAGQNIEIRRGALIRGEALIQGFTITAHLYHALKRKSGS